MEHDRTLADDVGEEAGVVGTVSRELELESVMLGVMHPDATSAYDFEGVDCLAIDLSMVTFRVCSSSLTCCSSDRASSSVACCSSRSR